MVVTGRAGPLPKGWRMVHEQSEVDLLLTLSTLAALSEAGAISGMEAEILAIIAMANYRRSQLALRAVSDSAWISSFYDDYDD